MKRWERYKMFADDAMVEQVIPWAIASILGLWVSISLVMTSPSVLIAVMVGIGAALIWVLLSITLVPFIVVWLLTTRSRNRNRKNAIINNIIETNRKYLKGK